MKEYEKKYNISVNSVLKKLSVFSSDYLMENTKTVKRLEGKVEDKGENKRKNDFIYFLECRKYIT